MSTHVTNAKRVLEEEVRNDKTIENVSDVTEGNTSSATDVLGKRLKTMSDESATDEAKLVVQPETMAILKNKGRDNMDALVTVANVDKIDLKKNSVDLLLMTDLSSSMTPRLDKLSDAINSLSKHFSSQGSESQVEVHMAIGYFHEDAYFPGLEGSNLNEDLPHGYKPFEDAKKFDQVASLNFCKKYIHDKNLYPATNLEEAIKKSVSVLKQRQLEEFEGNENRLQHIVILTDGCPNGGETSHTQLKKIFMDSVENTSIVMHILLLGQQVDIDLAEELTLNTVGGVMSYADKADNLDEAMSLIFVPIKTSSVPFSVLVKDKGGAEKINRFGILTESNNECIVKFNVGTKSDPGVHMGATFSLLAGRKLDTALMLTFVDDENDPIWKSPTSKMPEALKTALAAKVSIPEIRRRVTEVANTQGFSEAATLARSLVQDNADNFSPNAMQGLQAFIHNIDRASAQASIETVAPIGRTMSVTAAFSQSRYS
jgi:Mg-chelatase subunit ChlD